MSLKVSEGRGLVTGNLRLACVAFRLLPGVSKHKHLARLFFGVLIAISCISAKVSLSLDRYLLYMFGSTISLMCRLFGTALLSMCPGVICHLSSLSVSIFGASLLVLHIMGCILHSAMQTLKLGCLVYKVSKRKKVWPLSV